MERSHILKLCHNEKQSQKILMNDSTPSMTRWLETVKIARNGFEVLNKGEEQAMAWQLRNLAKVKMEVLAFSQGTNQTMTVILK
jgi:hypothetical protein